MASEQQTKNGNEPPENFQPDKVPPGVPLGLEFLLYTKQLLIFQRVDSGEWFFGEQNNGYQILNSAGERLYFAGETSGHWNRRRGNSRAWNINLYDYRGAIVMNCVKEYHCCCPPDAKVFESGQCVSVVHSGVLPFTVRDGDGNEIFSVTGNNFFNGGTATFPILTILPDGKAGKEVGRIVKKWGGVLKEGFTDADKFTLYYPIDLDVRMKGVLIYVTIMIDFMWHERDNSRRVRPL